MTLDHFLEEQFLIDEIARFVASSPRPLSRDEFFAFIDGINGKSIPAKRKEAVRDRLDLEGRMSWRAGFVWTAAAWAARDRADEEAWERRSRVVRQPDDVPAIAPPRPATSICQWRDCGQWIPNVEMEDHVRAHRGVRPAAELVPAETVFAGGGRRFATERAEYVVSRNRIERRTPDGKIGVLIRCPRCPTYVPIDKVDDHRHCKFDWCLTVGPHDHCFVRECKQIGMRHSLWHAAELWRFPDFPPAREDELVRIGNSRPAVIMEAIIQALRKQGRTVQIATHDGLCPSCGRAITRGQLIEAIRVSLEGPHEWIHPGCPSPALGRVDSRAGPVTDQTGADLIRPDLPVRGQEQR